VHHPSAMDLGQRVGDADRDPVQDERTQRLIGDRALERLALHVLGDEVRRIVIEVGIDHRCRAMPRHQTGQLHLTPKPRIGILVVELVPNHLDRDL
jgi:hypothetical protein